MIKGKILWCGPCDKEKVYSSVYRDKKNKIAYVKRFTVGGYILDRDYNFVPVDSEIMVFLERENVLLDFWFVRKKNMKTRKGEILLSEISVKGVKAKGIQLCGKKVISTLNAIEIEENKKEKVEILEDNLPEDNSEENREEAVPVTQKKTLEEISAEADALKNKMSNILKKFDDGSRDLFGDS